MERGSASPKTWVGIVVERFRAVSEHELVGVMPL